MAGPGEVRRELHQSQPHVLGRFRVRGRLRGQRDAARVPAAQPASQHPGAAREYEREQRVAVGDGRVLVRAVRVAIRGGFVARPAQQVPQDLQCGLAMALRRDAAPAVDTDRRTSATVAGGAPPPGPHDSAARASRATGRGR